MTSSMNRRVSVIAHQRAGTEWKSDGNDCREAHLGEVLLKTVGRNVAGVNGLSGQPTVGKQSGTAIKGTVTV